MGVTTHLGDAGNLSATGWAVGNGRYRNSRTDGSSTTKIHWAVTLTAVN